MAIFIRILEVAITINNITQIPHRLQIFY